MTLDRFREQVRTLEELRTIVGEPSPMWLKKELTALDEHMRRFIAHSPFLVVSTHASDGQCDSSPRGDAPGFVQVIDEHTLLIPDRRGNKRVDSFRNIIETGQIGLLFLIPGVGETLRVNGRAMIIQDEEWLAPLAAQDKRPLVGTVVEVEECFLQCAKALIRSKLWEPRTAPQSLPCAGAMLADHVRAPGYDAVKMQELLDGAYQNSLY